MKINPDIFKAYDVRGIYPEEINKDTVFAIGRAFVDFLKKEGPKIVVGRDNRLSSPELHQSLLRGLTDGGARVTDIGLATTPMLYWACAHYGFDGGISLTASHNPPQYNGLKLVGEGAAPLSGQSGLPEVRQLALRNKFSKEQKGEMIQKEVMKDYLNFNLEKVNQNDFQSLRVVVDAANAVPAILIEPLQKFLPLTVYPLFAELDGNFPNHSPNPLLPENLKALQKEVKSRDADFGVAFDGDGDRVMFVDEKGEIVSPDFVTALVAQSILKEDPGQKILYDLRSSNVVREIVKAFGGVPLMSRVGHAFIKERMRRENVVFAGEFSGHYYHRDHYFCEAPLMVLFALVREISQQKKSLSQLVKPLQVYYHSGELNFEVKDKEGILKRLETKYKNGEVSHLDGLRVDFEDWWFNARPSNTEPVLRLVVEARTPKMMEQKKKELSEIIST